MKKTLFAVIAATMIGGIAQADTIRATSGFGPSHVLATDVYPALFTKLSELTDGKWTGKDTASGLLAPNEMNTGLRDGITEMGAIILPYFAADYPESGLVAELSMLGVDNRVISSAATEYIATCNECLKEFSKAGQIYLGSDSTTTYEFLSTKPIRTLEDMKGLRIRTAGSVFTRLVEALGAEPVQMPASELFEGLSQGVLDATYSSIPDLKNARLYDVVTYVTEIHQGVFNGAATTNVSKILWKKMDAADRKALVSAAQYAQVVGVKGWRDTEAEARSVGTEKDIEFITPDAALLDAAVTFGKNHLVSVADTLEGRGVTNAAEKVERYKALIKKWTALIDKDLSLEELAELRDSEIWSKIDLATYQQN